MLVLGSSQIKGSRIFSYLKVCYQTRTTKIVHSLYDILKSLRTKMLKNWWKSHWPIHLLPCCHILSHILHYPLPPTADVVYVRPLGYSLTFIIHFFLELNRKQKLHGHQKRTISLSHTHLWHVLSFETDFFL